MVEITSENQWVVDVANKKSCGIEQIHQCIWIDSISSGLIRKHFHFFFSLVSRKTFVGNDCESCKFAAMLNRTTNTKKKENNIHKNQRRRRRPINLYVHSKKMKRKSYSTNKIVYFFVDVVELYIAFCLSWHSSLHKYTQGNRIKSKRNTQP